MGIFTPDQLVQLEELSDQGLYAEAYELIYLSASVFDAEGNASPARELIRQFGCGFGARKPSMRGRGRFPTSSAPIRVRSTR